MTKIDFLKNNNVFMRCECDMFLMNVYNHIHLESRKHHVNLCWTMDMTINIQHEMLHHKIVFLIAFFIITLIFTSHIHTHDMQ